MALVQPTQPIQPGKKGGGGLGGLLGLLGGIGATVATGGLAGPVTFPMVAGALGAATGGASVGQLVGGAVAPGKEAKQAQGGGYGQETMTNRLKSGEASAKMDQLKQSALAVTQLPQDQQAQYLEPLVSAADILKKQQAGSIG